MGAKLHSMGGVAAIGSLLLLVGCAGEQPDGQPAEQAGERATSEPAETHPVAIDCAEANPGALSRFALDAFQRDLAIHTPSKIAEHLDNHPELICATLESDRYGISSPIAYAAGHRPDAHGIFPLLVERGAEASDALPVAVWRGDSRVVPWLLEHGVDPNTESVVVLAAQRNDTRMVQRLLAAGADPNRPASENRWFENDGRSALHHAVRHDASEMIRTLLDAGADINAVDRQGRTPLAEAVRGQRPGTVRLLFDRGAAPTRMHEEDVARLRHLARSYGMTDIVEFLD